MHEPTPEQYNPPLSVGGHAWRITLCLILSGLAWQEVAGAQWEQARAFFFADLALGVLSFVAVFWRRRWPFAVALLTSVAAFASMSGAGPSALAFVSLATRRRISQIVVVGAAGVVAAQLFYYYEPQVSTDPPWLNFTFVTVITIALAAIGMYLGSRRELLWTLRERARQAEAEQELRMGQARSAERERIAREMHDVLAHRISLVAMHAGALSYRTDLPPEQIRETATLIQGKAHEALTDLRQVLGMLREDHVHDRPQPTLSDLPELVGEVSQGGMPVRLDCSLTEQPPDQVGRAVYRIVQEALTNARKHGSVYAPVIVRVDGCAEQGVSVTVRNTRGLTASRTPGAGLGLVGLRERAALGGGTLDVEETADAFTLRGWLPWTP